MIPAQLNAGYLLQINSPGLLGHCEGACNFCLCQTFVLTPRRRGSLGKKRQKRDCGRPVCLQIIPFIDSTFDYKGRRELLGAMEMFDILIKVVVMQPHPFVKIH